MSVGAGAIPFWGGSAAEGDTYCDKDPWYLAWIAGIKVPGKATVSPGGVARLDFQENKAKGRHGSDILIQGYKPGPFDINVEIWTADQHEKLLDLIDNLWTTPKKKTKLSGIALDIYHPALAYVKVYRGALIGVDPPKDGSFDGAKVIRFAFRESVLPDGKNATKKVDHTPSVAAPLKKGVPAPKGATPARPSADRKNLGPKGQKAPPAGGSD